ncbi:MAG: hypothetical protein JOY92_07585, partial [Verrucomicrobia bacterium]|nr:hypothetical protein [Verrucomicrobiota bacterium]
MNLPGVVSLQFSRFRTRPPFAIGVILFACLLWITSSAHAGSTCTSTISSNFNGTAISGGNYIWFNAHFTANGISTTTATTIYLTNSTISFTADQAYSVCVPNAQITFSPSATCTSTTYDAASGTWITTTPVSGEDEVFLSGVAFAVPASFSKVSGKVTNPVTWTGTFSSSASGVSIHGWQWGAAVYTAFPTNYNAANIKPGHQSACGYSGNSDHAGTPESEKSYLVAGAGGGGGSNYTGGWSGTATSFTTCTSVEPAVTIAAATSTILETAGSTPAFTLTRNQSGTAQTVYVQVTTGSGNAMLGTDYTVNSPATASGNVISVPFGASDTSKTISITPTDSAMSANESITWQVLS